MDRSLASFSLLSEKEIATPPWLKHEVKKKTENKKQNNHINVEKMIITVKYATYVAEKSKPENFRLAGIRTLPYLCDMGDISSSRSLNICNSYIGRFYIDDAYPSGRIWSNIL